MAEAIQPLGSRQPPDLLSAPELTGKSSPGQARFADALGSALRASGAVRLSAHAEQRLEDRGIELGPEHFARIERALENAGRKGARESVLILDEAALVASVTNRTIVTVVEPSAEADTVFTNVDSVVVVGE